MFSASGGTCVLLAVVRKVCLFRHQELPSTLEEMEALSNSFNVYKVPTSRFSCTLRNLQDVNSAHLQHKQGGVHTSYFTVRHLACSAEVCLPCASDLPGTEPGGHSGISKIFRTWVMSSWCF